MCKDSIEIIKKEKDALKICEIEKNCFYVIKANKVYKEDDSSEEVFLLEDKESGYVLWVGNVFSSTRFLSFDRVRNYHNCNIACSLGEHSDSRGVYSIVGPLIVQKVVLSMFDVVEY